MTYPLVCITCSFAVSERGWGVRERWDAGERGEGERGEEERRGEGETDREIVCVRENSIHDLRYRHINKPLEGNY